jgi:hypothetical protein
MAATRSSPGFVEVMEAVHRVMRGELDARDVPAMSDLRADRLALYAGFVRGHVRTAVEKNHAVLADVLRGPVWEALLAGFFREHPPVSYELNAAAEPFRAFLAGRVAAGAEGLTPFHVEIAELEWQEWAAYSSEAEAAVPEGSNVPVLNPTLRILSLDYPVAAFVEAWRRAVRSGASERPPAPTAVAPEVVFVFRDPTSQLAVFYRATEPLLFALKVAADGLDVTQAAEISGLPEPDVRATLARAAGAGLIVFPGCARLE